MRVQGGAYGTGMVTRINGFDGCYSYRDPSAAKTLEIYAKSAAFLRSFAECEPELAGLITGAISAGEPLLTPRAKGEEADDLYFRGITDELRRARRRQLLGCTCADLCAVADGLDAVLGRAGVCVLAPRAELERCALDEISAL